MSIVARTVVVVLAGLVLTACGSGDSDHSAHEDASSVPAPVDGAESATVTAVDIDFQPETLELTAGEPTNVTVVNEGEVTHDFDLEAAGVHAALEPGQEVTMSVTVDEPGDYKAICTVPGHEEGGMVIDVTVAE